MRSHHFTSHPFRLHRHSLSHVGALPALASNRLLAFTASSMVGVFLAIFLYEYFGFSIQLVLAWYAATHFLKIPIYILAAKIFSRTGLVKSMIFGTGGVLLFYLSFFLLDHGSSIHPNILMGAGILGLLIVGSFYWSPFHIDFAMSTSKKKRGKQIGVFYAAQRVVSVAAPLLAGFIITKYGYHINFIVGLIICASSITPLLFLPEFRVKYEFTFFETFKKVLSKKFRPMSVSMAAYGAENMVGVAVWPIFLYEVFQGNYLNVGAFTAAIVIIGFVLEIFVGKGTDKFSAKKMLKLGTGVYAFGWIWKGLVETVVGVFAASTFHTFGSILLRTPMDTLMYEQAADSGHYIDEYTVLREIALSAGRVAMLMVLILLTTYFSLGSAFFAAAAITLGINELIKFHAKST